MSAQIIAIPDMSLWSQSIGGLIINFGLIEFQTLQWIQKLGGDDAAIKARKDTLSWRITAAVALIELNHLRADGNSSAQAASPYHSIGPHPFRQTIYGHRDVERTRRRCDEDGRDYFWRSVCERQSCRGVNHQLQFATGVGSDDARCDAGLRIK